MKIEIDQKSGFCFGVVNAIEKAENTLNDERKLYCLGDIVHNDMEVKRLESAGLETIDHETYFTLENCKVLIRTHGEPPSTYEYAKANNIELIEGTCPVVLKLQQRIKKAHSEMQSCNGQIVIFGEKGHAEVVGLDGQTKHEAIIVENENDLEQVDPNRPVFLFAQTTKSLKYFQQLAKKLEERSNEKVIIKDTICRQVSNRVPRMQEFAATHDVILFVGGKKSSNAKILFDVCEQTNPDSYFISTLEEIDEQWFLGKNSVGICGATSTPRWLMEQVAEKIKPL